MLRTLLKREESYAIHALINIIENPGTNAAEIAERLSMPPAFVAKVLRKLVKANYIDSKMGRSGGVNIAVDPKTISLLNVIETISGPFVMDTCQVKKQCATQERKGHCRLKRAWLEASLDIRKSLESVCIADLSDQPKHQYRNELPPSPVQN
ncbi:MAG: Rrf2 family transcriptional regulator [Trueperaceae bacterium]|nr:Rrf2 family transcriptional regulator [Trueperaceae bacterium]